MQIVIVLLIVIIVILCPFILFAGLAAAGSFFYIIANICMYGIPPVVVTSAVCIWASESSLKEVYAEENEFLGALSDSEVLSYCNNRKEMVRSITELTEKPPASARQHTMHFDQILFNRGLIEFEDSTMHFEIKTSLGMPPASDTEELEI